MKAPSPAVAAGLALLAGALLPLALAPFGWWPLSLLSPALLLWSWQQGSARQLLLRGWLFGLGLFGVGASWVFVSIHVYGQTSLPLAALLTGLFCASLATLPALQGLAFAWFRSGRRSDACLLFPTLWLLFEWLRSWLLTGFPWLYLGHAHADTWLAGWAPFLGTFAISASVAACAGLLVQVLREPRFAGYAASAIALIWLAGAGLGHIRWVDPQPAVDTALVQGNVAQQLKWDPALREHTLQHYDTLSAPYRQHAILVWPEAALPVFADEIADWLEAQATRSMAQGSTLVTGIPTRTRQADGLAYYNSLIALGFGGGHYNKRQLVPFGEYVPLQTWLRGLIAFFDLPMSDFRRGAAWQHPLQTGDWLAAPLICYEIAYADYTATLARKANLIITVSNDTWFGHSIGPHQHLEIARLRALETGRPILRATNNGITALIDHHGRITDRLPQFETAVLRGDFQPTRGQTLFNIWGSWPSVMLAGLCLLVLMPQRKI